MTKSCLKLVLKPNRSFFVIKAANTKLVKKVCLFFSYKFIFFYFIFWNSKYQNVPKIIMIMMTEQYINLFAVSHCHTLTMKYKGRFMLDNRG